MKTLFTTLTAALFVFSTTLAISTISLAQNAAATKDSAVASKSTCSKFTNTTQPFILVLNSGDDLLGSITECAKDAKLKGASISGLGQVHNPTLAYFTSNPDDKPTLTALSGYFELASLNGNITNNDGKYYTHAHGVLADKKFHGIAGHIDSAKVGLTVEITVAPLSASAQRTVDPKTGFGLIVH